MSSRSTVSFVSLQAITELHLANSAAAAAGVSLSNALSGLLSDGSGLLSIVSGGSGEAGSPRISLQ